jgi:hypothetical protein
MFAKNQDKTRAQVVAQTGQAGREAGQQGRQGRWIDVHSLIADIFVQDTNRTCH